MYEVIITPVASMRLDKLDNFEKRGIIKRLSKLRENPRRISKRLSDYNLWSLKIGRGGYSAVFRIYEAEKIVRVVAIGKRENIYRDLQIFIRR